MSSEVCVTRLCWTDWYPFPRPHPVGGLRAEMFGHRGAGVYELRLRTLCGTKSVLFGQGVDVGNRMRSLLPMGSGGHGKRNNADKRQFVLKHLRRIEFRIAVCPKEQLDAVEMIVKRTRSDWVFPERQQRKKNPR